MESPASLPQARVLGGLSVESYDAMVRTAKELRIPFAGHVPPVSQHRLSVWMEGKFHETHSQDQIGMLEGGRAIFGKTYAAEPDA